MIVRVYSHPGEVSGTQKACVQLRPEFSASLSLFLFLIQPPCTVKCVFSYLLWGGIYFRPGERCCEQVFTFLELLEIVGAKANK